MGSFLIGGFSGFGSVFSLGGGLLRRCVRTQLFSVTLPAVSSPFQVDGCFHGFLGCYLLGLGYLARCSLAGCRLTGTGCCNFERWRWRNYCCCCCWWWWLDWFLGFVPRSRSLRCVLQLLWGASLLFSLPWNLGPPSLRTWGIFRFGS